MLTELFPNAHGLKLWAVVFAALISAACVGAFLHSLWELWRSHNPKKQVYHLDEFEDRDDPYAVLASVVRIFDTPFEMSAWIDGNILSELRQEQLMFEGVNHKKVNGIYKIVFVPTPTEREWIS
jgi:hypothetical protein